MSDVSDTPFRPGTIWMQEREKLYRFTESEAVVIKPWPKPQAWRKRLGKSWKPAAPLIDLASGSAAERMAWAQIPIDAREAVCRASFAGFQWPALSMIARCPGALALAQQEPMVFAMLSIGNRVRPIPVSWLHRSIRALLAYPGHWSRIRRIHDWLGLDTSRSFLRLTRKANMSRQHWRWHHWSLLLQLWSVPRGRKLLQHLPEVTPEHAELVEVLRRLGSMEQVASMLHPNLMRAVLEQGVFGGATMIAHDLAAVWPLVWHDRPLPVIRNLEHLEQLRTEVNLAYDLVQDHEYGEDAIRRQSVLDALNRGESAESLFPPPPLAGSSTIQPLRTPNALVREGESMEHCLRNHHWTLSSCMALGFAYHVDFEGERATVWVSRVADTTLGFRIEQIQGPNNRNPSEPMAMHVVQWFRRHEQWAEYRTGRALRPPGQEPPDLPEVWTRPIPMLVRTGPVYEDEIPF